MSEEAPRYKGRPTVERRAMPRIDVLVGDELRHRVRMAAAAEDVRLGEWVKRAIIEKLERDGR